ncbi:hypothetical protein RCC30_19555 [Pseudomonas fluorescens]|nr:hypothetical protein RCC30_19555 [Pseudomonas fluorescens]
MSIAHCFGQQSLHSQHFANMLSLPHNKIVDFKKALSPLALSLISETAQNQWRPSHYLIAKEIISQLLGSDMEDPRNWAARLADICIEFANFCRTNHGHPPADLKYVIGRVFFYRNDAELLGTISSGEKLFAEIINKIPNTEGRLRVFKNLVDLFSNEAHFWAHLGRFYSVQLKRFPDARDALKSAIALEPNDSVLHHMLGMVERSYLYQKIEQKLDISEIIDSATEASKHFFSARELSLDDEHKYISEVQMIIRVLDFAGKSGKSDPITAATNSSIPWLREALQRAEDLLATVRRMRQGNNTSEYEERCRAELDSLYGSHEKALQRWQNLLDRRDGSGKSSVYAPPIRRQIVWTYLSRGGRRWDKLKTKEIIRCVELLDENATQEPGNEANIRLWMQAARFLPEPPSIDLAIERIAYWKSITGSVDASYYLSALYAIQAIEGSTLALERHLQEMEFCASLSRSRRTRKVSFEWFASGNGLQQLLHADQLGDWDRATGFWTQPEPLERIEGSILSITGPQAGEIELEGGVRAFFVPGPSGFDRGRSENTRVSCLLGFSYDGPRAWSVKPL